MLILWVSLPPSDFKVTFHAHQSISHITHLFPHSVPAFLLLLVE